MPSKRAESFQPARVVEVRRENAHATTLVLAPLRPFAWRAGQQLQLDLRLGARRLRPWCALSAAGHEPFPAITVRRTPGSVASQYLTTRVAVGDELHVSAPAGDFLLPAVPAAGDSYVFLAADAGIVPVFAMLRTLLALPVPPPLRLLYCVRSVDDMMFRAALEELQYAAPGLRTTVLVTGPRHDWAGAHGPFHPDQLWALAADLRDPRWYLAAPPRIVAEAEAALHAGGVAAAGIRTCPPPLTDAVPRPTRDFPAMFVRRSLLFNRRRRLRVRAGESLLAAATRAGMPVRQECVRGSCGKCRVQVLRGQVAMDEPNCLSLEQQAAGQVLACISRPLTPLVLAWPR